MRRSSVKMVVSAFVIGLICSQAAWIRAAANTKGTCDDMIGEYLCKSYKILGLCEKDQKAMRITCAKSCGFCTPCEDRISKVRCLDLKGQGLCTSMYRRMKDLCPRTCGFCAQDCVDQHYACKKMAFMGNCTDNQASMASVCPSSCGHCRARTPCDELDCPLTTPCEIDRYGRPYCRCKVKCDNEKLTGPVCGTNGTHEETFKSLCAMLNEECKSLTFYTVKHYGHCLKQETCRDETLESFGPVCQMWKNKGACKTHRGVMQFYCPKSCRLCRQPAPPPICAKSEYGCCWNSDQPASGKYGVGCKTCKDKVFCRYFGVSCGDTRNVASMRSYCPGMCRYCVSEDIIKQRTAK